MIKSWIIVSGPTGKRGSVVVAELLKTDYPRPHHGTNT